MSKPHFRMMNDGQMMPAIRAADGYRNLVANIGTSRDKASFGSYHTSELTYQQLINAYRGSSLAKGIVDIPAGDSCREWREWQAEADQISAIEAEEVRLGVQAKVLHAMKSARLFGGSAIFIGTGESDTTKPLNPARVSRGGIQYLTVMQRRELSPGRIQNDPRQPGYGRPIDYSMTSGAGTLRIHPSRLVVFQGDKLPDDAISGQVQGWSDSVLQVAMDKIGHLDSTLANVASLVFEAKVDVIRIQDFMQNLQTGGKAYEQLVLQRFGLSAMTKGINGALLLDGNEDYDQKSANFSTLPDIIDRFMQMVSSAARIPMTLFFGMSPGGLNATGESDLRNYYDDVRQMQTLEMQPEMAVLDEALIYSALGNRPEEVHYNWRPLWQMSDKDKAEIADKLTTAAEKMMRAEVPMEVVSTSLVNALTELGAFPGLEAAMAEFTSGSGDGPLSRTETITGEPEGNDE